MPTPQLALPQQFGRFLLAGALIFTILFWGLSSVLMSNQDVHRDIAAVVALSKSLIHQPFANWFRDVETAYIPFFLRQHSLLACYSISFVLAWLAAFLYDIKILRKENIL
jgi:predicted membrane-bound mannosyltransferase